MAVPRRLAAPLTAVVGLLASKAAAVTLTFTGLVTAGVDNGAVFAPLGSSLVGDPISVSFGLGGYGGAPAGTTSITAYLDATVTIDGQAVAAGDNDFATPMEFAPGPPDTIDAGAEQTFPLGYSTTAVRATGAALLPPGADLNSAFVYHLKPGDSGAGSFTLANVAFPGEGYDGPPFGGPGSAPPWADTVTFSVDTVYANLPGPVPEPASWMMAITGLALAGAGLRRRAPGRRQSRLGR